MDAFLRRGRYDREAIRRRVPVVLGESADRMPLKASQPPCRSSASTQLLLPVRRAPSRLANSVLPAFYRRPGALWSRTCPVPGLYRLRADSLPSRRFSQFQLTVCAGRGGRGYGLIIRWSRVRAPPYQQKPTSEPVLLSSRIGNDLVSSTLKPVQDGRPALPPGRDARAGVPPWGTGACPRPSSPRAPHATLLCPCVPTPVPSTAHGRCDPVPLGPACPTQGRAPGQGALTRLPIPQRASSFAIARAHARALRRTSDVPVVSPTTT